MLSSLKEKIHDNVAAVVWDRGPASSKNIKRQAAQTGKRPQRRRPLKNPDRTKRAQKATPSDKWRNKSYAVSRQNTEFGCLIFDLFDRGSAAVAGFCCCPHPFSPNDVPWWSRCRWRPRSSFFGLAQWRHISAEKKTKDACAASLSVWPTPQISNAPKGCTGTDSVAWYCITRCDGKPTAIWAGAPNVCESPRQRHKEKKGYTNEKEKIWEKYYFFVPTATAALCRTALFFIWTGDLGWTSPCQRPP